VNTGRIALVTSTRGGGGPLRPELERRVAELDVAALATGITDVLAGRVRIPPPESCTPYDQDASGAACMELMENTP
jgi:hypothetical protein